jgi:N-acetylglucosaminyldiphosphoundecaprenol N-acetyl-beta-D-mannosaminyltransferase
MRRFRRYFTDDGPIIEKINALRPDIVLVCLGAPNQERWMHDNREKVNARLMMASAGSLDVFFRRGGAPRRKSWVKANWSGLYRLLKEPRRIGRIDEDTVLSNIGGPFTGDWQK